MNHKYCISVSGQRESNRNKSTPIEIGKSRTGRDSSHMTRMTHIKWVISEFSAFKSEDRYMDINYKIRTKLFSKEQDKKGFHSGQFIFDQRSLSPIWSTYMKPSESASILLSPNQEHFMTNGSPLMNIDITGALFTLRIQFDCISTFATQFEDHCVL